MESIRTRRNDFVDGPFGPCDCISYCYFSLAVLVFIVGVVITVLALEDSPDSLFSALGHIWLVGPIFISSGLMVAIKTVLYVRKKNLMELIIRQRALLMELQVLQYTRQLVRNPSIITIPPPPYDLVVVQGCGQPATTETVDGGSLNAAGGSPLSEPPPPTYEEAMILSQMNSRDFLLTIQNTQHEVGKDSNA